MTIFEKTTKIYWVNQNDYLTLILWNIKHFWYKQKKGEGEFTFRSFMKTETFRNYFPSKLKHIYWVFACLNFSVFECFLLTFPFSFCYRKFIIYEPALKKNKRKTVKWWISHLAFTFFLCWGLKKSINYWSFRYFLQKWQTNRWAGPLSLSLSCFHVMYNKTYCFTFLISSSFIFK